MMKFEWEIKPPIPFLQLSMYVPEEPMPLCGARIMYMKKKEYCVLELDHDGWHLSANGLRW